MTVLTSAENLKLGVIASQVIRHDLMAAGCFWSYCLLNVIADFCNTGSIDAW